MLNMYPDVMLTGNGQHDAKEWRVSGNLLNLFAHEAYRRLELCLACVGSKLMRRRGAFRLGGFSGDGWAER